MVRQYNNFPIFPKATCIWLLENTILTFKQIADFCGIHELEVQGIADNEVAVGIKPLDPITNNQLTKAEIERCSKDPYAKLQLLVNQNYNLASKKKKTNTTKYTPIARRQDKPNAIYWLLKHYPAMSERQIKRLIGTTTTTITAIKERSHWDMKNIKPSDPVLLGLTTQIELDRAIESIKPIPINNNEDV